MSGGDDIVAAAGARAGGCGQRWLIALTWLKKKDSENDTIEAACVQTRSTEVTVFDASRPCRISYPGPGAKKKHETARANTVLSSTSRGSTTRTIVPRHCLHSHPLLGKYCAITGDTTRVFVAAGVLLRVFVGVRGGCSVTRPAAAVPSAGSRMAYRITRAVFTKILVLTIAQEVYLIVAGTNSNPSVATIDCHLSLRTFHLIPLDLLLLRSLDKW